jgi:hypothetical protein
MVSFLGIFVSNFWYSVFAVQYVHGSCRDPNVGSLFSFALYTVYTSWVNS